MISHAMLTVYDFFHLWNLKEYIYKNDFVQVIKVNKVLNNT